MLTLQFLSLTHAGKAMTHLRSQGIESKLEKGTASGCAYRLRVEGDSQRVLPILRGAQIAFTVL